LNYKNDEEILADRAIAPRKNDVFYFYKKYRNQKIQTYIAPEKDDSRRPFILVILTNLILRCHALQEAGELNYMNTIARLDILNTPLTILSTSIPAGDLPLGVILTSDKSANTFSKVLDVLKHLIPSIVFGKDSSAVGPQMIMTDNYRAERIVLHNTWNNAILLLCVFHFLQAM
ncbi:13381_t:CDS:2, partial [Gigaspora margarita]